MNIKAFIKNSVGVWLVLFAIALPFPYYLIPNWPTVHSDTELMYLMAFTLFAVSLLVNTVLLFFKTLHTEQLSNILHVLVVYILAFFLLKYGADKLFKHQFYLPEPNTLHTPLGHLSKDILFWSSMSSSYVYNVFMGLIEIIPAILILIKRTRLLGVVISLAVLLNVWMINIGFDITVKILSTYLVICSVFLLTKYTPQLSLVFLQEKGSFTEVEEVSFIKSSIIRRALKASVIALFILEVLLPYFESQGFNGDNSIKPYMYGSYELTSPALLTSIIDESTVRLHMHSKGYLIVEDKDHAFKDYRVITSKASNSIRFLDENLELKIAENGNTFSFNWIQDSTVHSIKTQKIDLENLPIMDDSFHWTTESFVH